MQVVGSHDRPDPGEVLRAGPQGAVRSCPLRLAVQPFEAETVVVRTAGAVAGAGVLAITDRSPPSIRIISSQKKNMFILRRKY